MAACTRVMKCIRRHELHPWITKDGCRTAKGTAAAPYTGGHPMGTQMGSRCLGGVFAGLLNAPPELSTQPQVHF